MACFTKRKWKKKTTYRVQVKRVGFKSIYSSFDTLTDAKKWARKMEGKTD